MGVSAPKVYQKVRNSWIHTSVSFLVMLGLLAILLAVCAEFGLSRPVMVLLEGAAGSSLLLFLFSELVIVIWMRGKRVLPEDGSRAYALIEAGAKKHRMKMPRVYILTMKSPIGDKVPNAVAFGLGFFGQYAVAYTERIDELMDEVEMKAVLEHELGHLRSKDVGLMSMISILVGGSRQIGQMLFSGQTMLGRTPWAVALGLFVLVLNRILFPIALAAIAQEREYAADSLSALALESPDPMISALRKLDIEAKRLQQRVKEKIPEFLFRSKGPFDELFLSHPGMEERIASLESLRG